VGDPEDLDWLAGKMGEIAVTPASDLTEIGQRGKQYGLGHFSKAAGVSRLAQVILTAATGTRIAGVRGDSQFGP
jgi:hypothetical protein